VLLVGNHSGGTLIADTFVFATEFYTHFGPQRRFHQLAHDVAARIPATGLSRWGTVAASHDNARKAFDRGAPVLVYPGGDYETFRPSWQSDRVDFGGRKGTSSSPRAGGPDRAGGRDRRAETALFLTRGQRAAKLIGRANLTGSGAARRTRASVWRERARPADAYPLAGEDHDRGAAAVDLAEALRSIPYEHVYEESGRGRRLSELRGSAPCP
jgi:hypothetical protein